MNRVNLAYQHREPHEHGGSHRITRRPGAQRAPPHRRVGERRIVSRRRFALAIITTIVVIGADCAELDPGELADGFDESPSDDSTGAETAHAVGDDPDAPARFVETD